MSYHTIKSSTPGDEYKPCTRKSCMYHMRSGAFHGCNYITITGKSRIAQHGPDEQSPHKCKLYQKGKHKRIRNKGEYIYGY